MGEGVKNALAFVNEVLQASSPGVPPQDPPIVGLA
jgi:hypothetical protein